MGILYIDEAGDPGFALKGPKAPGSSELLVIAGVYFPARADLHKFRFTYQGWRRGTHRDDSQEFKFAREKDYHRTGFLNAAMTANWRWNAFVLAKSRVLSRGDPNKWYRRSFNWLLETISQHAQVGTLVFADRRDMSSAVRQLFREEVRKRKNTSKPGDPEKYVDEFYGAVKFLDSKKSEGVQLADAVAGSVSLAFRSWSRPDPQYRDLIAGRCHVCQVWPKESP